MPNPVMIRMNINRIVMLRINSSSHQLLFLNRKPCDNIPILVEAYKSSVIPLTPPKIVGMTFLQGSRVDVNNLMVFEMRVF